jgi:23S rRNA (guanosine2251-2'-O)-methyltransferase
MARVVYGVHPVREALRAGRVQALFLAEGDSSPALRGIVDDARAANVQPVSRARAALDALAHGGAHQGALAITGEYPYAQLDELVDAAKRAGVPPLLLVLDSVQDPQNLGALVRSAHVMGAHGLVLQRDRAVGVTATVVKASAGATEHTRIAMVTNVARALEELKAAGLWIAGGVADGGEPPWKIDLKGPIALVVGAEGKGIRPLVLRGCDFLVQIPMVGRVASLNVSAAGAMLLYEAARQRSDAARR